MKITQKDLSNMVKMAYIGDNSPIVYKRVDEHRDIEIKLSYCPDYCPKDDIYPYFTLEMREEELQTKYFFNTNELPLIKEVFNRFISQGIGESYLQNTMHPY